MERKAWLAQTVIAVEQSLISLLHGQRGNQFVLGITKRMHVLITK